MIAAVIVLAVLLVLAVACMAVRPGGRRLERMADPSPTAAEIIRERKDRTE